MYSPHWNNQEQEQRMQLIYYDLSKVYLFDSLKSVTTYDPIYSARSPALERFSVYTF